MKVKLLQTTDREVVYSPSLGVISNGEKNNYAEEIEYLINNSITASMASAVMVSYLLKDFQGDAASRLKAEKIAESLVKHKGVFISVEFNLNFEISNYDLIPYSYCRLGKKDSQDYNGKILVNNDWSKKDKAKIVDVFNPNKKIVEKQIQKAGGIEKYQGQVFYFNKDYQFHYALSRIESVKTECENEYLISKYKTQLLKQGFIGKTIFFTRKNTNQNLLNNEPSESDIYNPSKLLDDDNNVDDELKKFVGVENVGGILRVEVDWDGEKLEDAICLKTIESKIDPNLFSLVEQNAMKKILMAFNNMPICFVQNSEGVFGNSGELIAQMRQNYHENTQGERDTLNFILNQFKNGNTSN